MITNTRKYYSMRAERTHGSRRALSRRASSRGVLPLRRTPLEEASLLAERLTHALDTDLCRRSLRQYHWNPLYLWLCEQFAGRLSTGQVEDVCHLYKVGTALKWGGSTVFWQVDDNLVVRAGKIMGYDRVTGRRIKKPHPLMTWVHALPDCTSADYSLRQCMFGTHLAAMYPEARLWIFESEKGALTAALMLLACGVSDIVCLGAGGCEGFAPGRHRMDDPLDPHFILRSRRVVLFPDEGKGPLWLSRGEELSAYAESVDIVPLDMDGTMLWDARDRYPELRPHPGDGPDDLIIRALRRPAALAALLDALPLRASDLQVN